MGKKYTREVIITGFKSCRKFNSIFLRLIDSLSFWPRLFERLDNGIHWINQFIFKSLIYWIAIYPLDSTIRPLYNWALVLNAS